jgi:choline dehydrogenase-like flavoprotein
MIGARNMVWADVVVIGSGVAGAITAYKLAKAGVKTVILEAGPRIDRAEIVKAFTQSHNLDLSAGFPHEKWAPRPDWGTPDGGYIEYTGPEVSKVEYLKVVGGTTWHWAAVAIRMTPAEMKMKTTYDLAVDWPISYDELEPFYCEAEYEIGVSGDSTAADGSPRSRPYPMPMIPHSYSDKIIQKTAKTIGIDFIARPGARNSTQYDGRIRCQGFGTCSPICPSGAQYNAGIHVKKAEDLGVKLLDNTRVDKIFTDEKGNIRDVLAVTKDGTELTVRGKIFVLAANGLESPKLMMMNADESRPDGIGNSSGLVGKYYFDHPGIYCRIVMPEPVYPRGPENTMTSHNFRDGDFRKKRAGWTMAVYNRPHIDDITRELLVKGTEPPSLDKELRHRVIRQLEIDTHVDQLPDINNALSLNWNKHDSAGHPVMKMHYSYSDYEQAGFAHSRSIFKKMVKALKADVVHTSEPFAHHHLMGTTRMGNDPKTSVVDAQCRSHDHKNLFVISSSVFPTGGAANPTLTIAALALRAGEEILRQLKNEEN